MGRSYLKPCITREMTPTEAAWLAGFFDGEGSLSHFMGGRTGRCPTWILTISNTDLAALEQCLAFTRAGTITRKSIQNRPAHHKLQHQWRVNTQRDIVSICRQMLPYLVTKRPKAETFLSDWVDLPKPIAASLAQRQSRPLITV